jgi:anti-anti-sigma regulatory factor
MLRITRQANDGGGVTLLKLEGTLRDAWLAELTLEVTQARDANANASLALDLAGVTFVDAGGVAVLRELLAQRAQIVACSGFVAASLGLEKP